MPRRKSHYHEQLQETHEEIIVHRKERRTLKRALVSNQITVPLWTVIAMLNATLMARHSIWLAVGGVLGLGLAGRAILRRRFLPLEIMFSVVLAMFVSMFFVFGNPELSAWMRYGMGALMGALAFGIYWSSDHMVAVYRRIHGEEHTHVERLEARLHESRSAYARRTTKSQRYRNKSGSDDFTENEWMDLCFHYNYTCLRCKRREPEIMLTPDHVVPLARGGTNTIDNIQPLCLHCNTSKNARHIDYRGGDA